MLLNGVDATNSRGDVLTLPLGEVFNGFFIKEIEGLGPVKATLVSSSFANQDGEQYHSSRREARNIVIKLGLEPDYSESSVQTLRERLYQFFMPKTNPKLTFHAYDKFAVSDFLAHLDVDIEARVESCEPDMFSKDPAMDISVMCFDPDFVDPNLVTFEGLSVDDDTNEIISYPGTVETGVVFTLMVDRALPEFSIYHQLPDQSLKTIDFTLPLEDGDVLKINSNHGSKGAKLTRAAVETSVLYGLTPQSAWLELAQGENELRVYAEGAAIPYTLEYYKKYGGL